MTDVDVVTHASQLLGNARVRESKRLVGKTMWTIAVAGAKAAGWMMTLYPFLGMRRRAKILEILNEWRQRPCANRFKVACIRGHALTEENVYVVAETGHRQCRVCRRIHDANCTRRKKEKAV